MLFAQGIGSCWVLFFIVSPGSLPCSQLTFFLFSSPFSHEKAKYGALARGDAEVYLRLPRVGKRYEEKIWDHAAGTVEDAYAFDTHKALKNELKAAEQMDSRTVEVK